MAVLSLNNSARTCERNIREIGCNGTRVVGFTRPSSQATPSQKILIPDQPTIPSRPKVWWRRHGEFIHSYQQVPTIGTKSPINHQEKDGQNSARRCVVFAVVTIVADVLRVANDWLESNVFHCTSSAHAPTRAGSASRPFIKLHLPPPHPHPVTPPPPPPQQHHHRTHKKREASRSMAVGFRRTLSTLTSPKAVAPSFLLDCARPKKLSYARVRSTSLPVRLHPLVAGLHDAARSLLKWTDAPAQTGPAWVADGADRAGKVLAGLADLLHHPQAQDALRRPWTEQLLDDLLLLADLHGCFRESLNNLPRDVRTWNN
uniref:Uncharacterized protein n=1 Tax=Oryza glumipatula TaxID=40148 RepID=A0A0E0BDA0_9ORYZ